VSLKIAVNWAWWCMPVISKLPRRWREKDSGLRPSWEKKSMRLYLRAQVGYVVCGCNPSHKRHIGRSIMV
jgi:hypothetical protein